MAYNAHVSNPITPSRLLRLGGERRGEHGSQASDEGAAVYLINDLIRPPQQRRGGGEAEGFWGLHVDDEFEFGRLLAGQGAMVRPFENTVDVGGRAAKLVGKVRAI